MNLYRSGCLCRKDSAKRHHYCLGVANEMAIWVFVSFGMFVSCVDSIPAELNS